MVYRIHNRGSPLLKSPYILHDRLRKLDAICIRQAPTLPPLLLGSAGISVEKVRAGRATGFGGAVG